VNTVRLALLLLLLTQGCFPSVEHGNEHKFARGPFAPGEKARLLNGEIIGRALVLYSENNNGKFPDNLTALVPAYIGTNINIASFALNDQAQKNPGSYVIIAAEKNQTNARTVVIRADGIAYLLRPGD